MTGARAGATAGVNDVDGGATSIQSPAITIPAGGTATVAFTSYFSHGANSSDADFFRAEVIGNTTTTVLEVRGSATDVDAKFVRQSFDISAFAGQTVRIRFTVADNSPGSLVEGAIDDVTVTHN